MIISWEMLIFLVALALAFDFMNGFHDAANSIATVVSTRVRKPHVARRLAAAVDLISGCGRVWCGHEGTR